jgi:ribosome biogenesis GTPase / thiamine phosphate phosphatase
MNMDKIGWQSYKQAAGQIVAGNFDVGRIAVENKTNFLVYSVHGESVGVVRGKLLKTLKAQELPKVGDWVLVSKVPDENKVAIEAVLPRISKISRQAPHTGHEQVIATNIDILFIVSGLDLDFNLRRIERYLALANQSNIRPVLVLNKIDLNDSYYEAVAEVKAIAQDIPVIALSASTGQGLELVSAYLEPGSTVAFLGSSGVGKSSIINALAGTAFKTQTVRLDDGRGRHTTTRREMVFLPNGAILIDTPGMRELALLSTEEGGTESFTDIEYLAQTCRFTNCDHDKSQGCAVKAALEDGSLLPDRYANYLKLKKESEYRNAKADKNKYLDRKRKNKGQNKTLKKILKNKYSR